jgi:hypothetical protein
MLAGGGESTEVVEATTRLRIGERRCGNTAGISPKRARLVAEAPSKAE